MKKEFNLEEEIQNDFLVTTERKKIWKIELELLKKFIEVCDKYNITYFLDGGSLLGAIRHGGFIPWDDDIDVILPREDYDKLLLVADNEFKEPYHFQSTYSEKNYFRGHCQLRNSLTCGMLPGEANKVSFNQGIFIDIFVLDNIENDKKSFELRFKKLMKYKKKLLLIVSASTYSSNKLKKIIKKAMRICFKILFKDEKNIFEKFENIAKECNEKDSKFVDNLTFRNNINEVLYLNKEWFRDKQNIKFENLECSIPKGYDAILKMYYGDDYMTPKNISSEHGNVIFNTDKSYTEVLKEESYD